MKNIHVKLTSVAALVLLAACGSSPGDRAMSGAVLGGVTGAAVGGLTKKKDVDLGTPLWR